jgi:hypothetical protein
MGRVLSDLQKTILRLALANHEDEGRTVGDPFGCDVGYAEILATHFGFKPRRPLRYPPDSRICKLAGPRALGGYHFSKAAIGDARYHVAHVTLTRTVRRLEARGLAAGVGCDEFRHAGVNLTAAGLAVARELSVSSCAHGPET